MPDNLLGRSATDGFPFMHTGARYYDPSTGRFLQRDPIGISGGLNVYAYCGNNPVIRIDPSGLDPLLHSPIMRDFRDWFDDWVKELIPPGNPHPVAPTRPHARSMTTEEQFWASPAGWVAHAKDVLIVYGIGFVAATVGEAVAGFYGGVPLGAEWLWNKDSPEYWYGQIGPGDIYGMWWNAALCVATHGHRAS